MTIPSILASLIGAANGRPLFQGAKASSFSIRRSALGGRKHSDLDTACMALLDRLAGEHPIIFLWAAANSDWKQLLREPSRTTGQAMVWRLDSLRSFCRHEALVSEGGWALFFFDPNEEPKIVPNQLGTDGPRLESVLTEIGAKAAVVSWYDNTEWLVTIRGD